MISNESFFLFDIRMIKEFLIAPIEHRFTWVSNLFRFMLICLALFSFCYFRFWIFVVLFFLDLDNHNKRELLKLEDYILEGYEIRHYNGSWISNTTLLYKESNGIIGIYDFEAKKKRMLLDAISTVSFGTLQYFALFWFEFDL